jgi:ubiquinone biosynthesis protein Coq4
MLCELTDICDAVKSIGMHLDKIQYDHLPKETFGYGYSLELLASRMEELVTKLDEEYELVEKKMPQTEDQDAEIQ